MDAWLEGHEEGAVVVVWVVPGASSASVVGLHGDAVKVRVAAPAEGGRANRAVAALLVAVCGADSATLLSGASSRRKRFLLRGITPDRARALLSPRRSDE